MTLHFLCPQGHHLKAPPERAGQPAACPRCQVRFLIPDRRRTDFQSGNNPSEEPLTAARLPGERNGTEATVEEASDISSTPPRHSWPGIVAGLVSTARRSRGRVALELEDGTCYDVQDILLPRSTGAVAVVVVDAGERHDVVAVEWRRVVRCRLEGWAAVNNVRPLGGSPRE